MMSLLLQDILVVDLMRILVGFFVIMIFGDLGVDVIKVESFGQGDDTCYWGLLFFCGMVIYFLFVNCNKCSVIFDLKSIVGSDVLWCLFERVDVVVLNFRVGLMSELGFGYDDV